VSTGPVARRNFLGSISAVGLLAAAPLWLQNAFAEDAACKGSLRTLAALGVSFRRAHSSGKRLLVLVIPSADAEKRERGELFGAWLNHGPDSGLAALSLCELACATMVDLRRLVPNAPDGEPLMVLVDPSALGRPGIAITPAVPQIDASRPVWEAGADWQKVMRERDLRERSEWDARIAVVSRAVRVAVAPGLSFPDEAAAAAAVRSRWVQGKVPGSHWANASGCGTDIEGVESKIMVACGMGHVPAKAERFLYLFTRAPYGGGDLPP
jgi:hypothetical protein